MYIYVNNTERPNCFDVLIPDGVDISGEIGLSEIHFEFNKNVEFFDVCCDVCEPSVVDSREQIPILRRIHANKAKEYVRFDPIFYIPVIKTRPWVIQIYLRSVHTHFASVDLKSLTCTLHQRQ